MAASQQLRSLNQFPHLRLQMNTFIHISVASCHWFHERLLTGVWPIEVPDGIVIGLLTSYLCWMSGGAPLSDLNIHRGLTHGYSKNPSSFLRALLNLLIHAALSGPNKIWASGVVNLHLNENLLPGAWTNAQGTIDSAFSFPPPARLYLEKRIFSPHCWYCPPA